MSQLQTPPGSNGATVTGEHVLGTPQWEGVAAPKRLYWRAQRVVSRHQDAFLMVALIAAGIALRLWINRGLWLDEATSISQTKMEFGRMLSYLRTSDAHPPLFHMLLWSDIRLFGDGQLAVRMPSIVLGTALIPLMYGAGRELFNRRTGVVAAVLATISPSMIWYSQEARMYALFMVLATITIWAQARCVRGGNNKAWVVYTVSASLMIWAHYFASFFVLAEQLAFLALIWQKRGSDEGREMRSAWIRSVGGMILLLAPLAVMTYGQLDRQAGVARPEDVNGAVAVGSPIYTVFSSLASAMIGYHSDRMMTIINALWPLGMLASLLALGRGRSRSTAYLISLVLIPLSVLFVLSFKRVDVLELRYFAGAVPVILLLIARGVTLISRKNMTAVVLTVAILGTMGTGLVDEQRAGANPRVYDFQSVLTDLNNQYQPGDLMLFEPFYLHPTIKYYARDFQSYPLLAGLSSTTAPKRIFIVGSNAFSDKELSRKRLNTVVDRLSKDRHLDQYVMKNHIEYWVFS